MDSPVKIVLIDDDPDLVDSVQRYLQRHSYSVATALGGREGLALVKESRPDLVILDVMMPDLDGIEVLENLKKDEAAKEIPVLMLTAKEAQSDRVKALEIGAYEYVTKPLDTHMLLRQIENILRKKKQGQL